MNKWCKKTYLETSIKSTFIWKKWKVLRMFRSQIADYCQPKPESVCVVTAGEGIFNLSRGMENFLFFSRCHNDFLLITISHCVLSFVPTAEDEHNSLPWIDHESNVWKEPIRLQWYLDILFPSSPSMNNHRNQFLSLSIVDEQS